MFGGFPIIAGGYLLSSATSGQKADAVTGAVATKTATAGLWGVVLPVAYDPFKHLIFANVTGITSTDDFGVDNGPSGNGFLLQAKRANVATNLSIYFVVVERPE